MKESYTEMIERQLKECQSQNIKLREVMKDCVIELDRTGANEGEWMYNMARKLEDSLTPSNETKR